MQQELGFVTDLLDSRGLREGDTLCLAPLFGKRVNFKLMRSRLDFATSLALADTIKASFKKIDPLGKEKLHYRLEVVDTVTRNNQFRSRYKLKTLVGAPFKHNGGFVNEAFLERGDLIELGHNNLEVKAAENFNDTEYFDAQSLKIIKSDLPILLTGETGTGKTTLAKKAHELSKEERPFIHLNLSSFSKNLLESELFGHVKGAFTGAMNDKAGALREANGGTLFLDEIDSLPIEIQTKLLIFLDEFKVRPVGSSIEKEVHCRLICASGSNLKERVKAGKMRRDFYYRIASGLNVDLPSMRHNEAFIEQMCDRFCLDNKIMISPNLLEFYKTLPWPGNIRQLYGHLNKKIVYATSSKIEYDKFDEVLALESSDLESLKYEDNEGFSTLEEVKREYVKNMYFRCGQSASIAAKKLAISSRSVKSILERSAG